MSYNSKIIMLVSVLYRIAGKFGGGEVWRNDSFRAFGVRKFGKLMDQPIGYCKYQFGWF